MMEALANAEPLPAAELPPREERGPGLGKEGALVADLLKLLLKIRARESNVAPRLVARSRGAGAARRRPARGPRRSSKAGASRSSAATRSIWSRAGSPSRSADGKLMHDPHRAESDA